jgi:hypothetical protein
MHVSDQSMEPAAPSADHDWRSGRLGARARLIQLAQKHRFQIELATSIVDALIAALADVERYSGSELTLLKGAVEYFIELEDDAHDLKAPNGFEDDAQVARSVLEVIGRADLASSVTPPVAVT